jgi:signal transduction histidine kinase
MRGSFLLFSIFVFFCSLSVFAQPKERFSFDIGTTVQLRRADFVQRNWGFVRSPKTVHIPIDSSNGKRYLIVENPHVNQVRLVRRGVSDSFLTGDHFFFEHRPVAHRFFIFPLTANAALDTLMLTLDKSGENLSVGLRLLDEAGFVRFLERDLFLLGGVAGFYGLAILLSFVLFLHQRKAKFFFFFLYVFFSLSWIWNDMGLLFAEVWPTSLTWHKSSRGFFSSLTILLFALYLRQNKVLLFGRPLRIVVQLVLLLFSFKFLLAFVAAGGFFPERLKLMTLYFNAIGLLSLFSFITGYLLWNFRRYSSIRFEILSILVYCLFVITLSLKELGLTIFSAEGLYGNEALLFFPLQCLFISIYLYRQIVAERRAAEKALIDFKLRQQQDTLKLMLEVEEGEKKRIAQNVHDEVGGIFVALRYQALLLRRLFSNGLQQKDLDTLVSLTDEGIKKQYTIVDDLLFGASSAVSWEEAVQKHIGLLAHAHGLQIDLFGASTAERLSPLAQTQVFRILAELLNNTIKHAGATHVEIALSSSDGVLFSYRDNGNGFDTKMLRDGRGMINIRQRVEALQGVLNMESDARGTRFQLQIPTHYE